MKHSCITPIIKISDSQGIRIPKRLLAQVGLKVNDSVRLEVGPNWLMLRPIRVPRQGWEERFQRMAENGDAKLLDADTNSLTSWDETEWVW